MIAVKAQTHSYGQRICTLSSNGHQLLSTKQLKGRRKVKIVCQVIQQHKWTVPPSSEVITTDPSNNVTSTIYQKLGQNLHTQVNHPLQIIKQAIYDYFDQYEQNTKWGKYDDQPPIVTNKACFDEVLVPEGHVSRLPQNTYYISDEWCLRTHTSAHQTEILRMNEEAFLVSGDVYRRDTIDATHYPVFHQMEGVRLLPVTDNILQQSEEQKKQLALQELKTVLEGLCKYLFGDVQIRWVDAYFPFTEPSQEIEVYFNGKWLEVLGCGVMVQSIIDDSGAQSGRPGWAFGLGLERLAMILFDIPDIRLFWSKDERFLNQFRSKNWRGMKFQSFSKYPPNYKDIAFWIPEDFDENSFYELVRESAGDLAEEVQLIDNFTHPKKQKTSHCYRITYRSMERGLTDEEINKIQEQVRNQSSQQLQVELR